LGFFGFVSEGAGFGGKALEIEGGAGDADGEADCEGEELTHAGVSGRPERCSIAKW
jgi:hypothetical protein